jgi:hypothetical protein
MKIGHFYREIIVYKWILNAMWYVIVKCRSIYFKKI